MGVELQEIQHDEEGQLISNFLMMIAQGVPDKFNEMNRITMFREMPDIHRLSLMLQGMLTGTIGMMLGSFDASVSHEEAEKAVTNHILQSISPIIRNIRMLEQAGVILTEKT